MPGMMPTITPMKEDIRVGRNIRLYSSLVIRPSSFSLEVSIFCAFARDSALLRISTRAKRPIRHTARSSPRYSLLLPKVKRS